MSEQPEVHTFDTFEEAREFIERGDAFGQRNLHPRQKEITWGDYWVRFYNIESRLIIFGHVDTLAEIQEGEEKNIDQITDPAERVRAQEEVGYTIETLTASHERGYLWGWAYSKRYQDIGSTHRFNVWPITKDLYDAAEAVEWDIDRLDLIHRGVLQQAWTEYRTHAIAVAESGDHP